MIIKRLKAINYRFIYFFFLVFTIHAKAQLDFRRAKYGFVIGPDISQVQHAHNPSSPRISFYTGVFARIPIGILCACENPYFYLQPQLEYIQAGEKGSKNTLYASNYISLPIYIKTYPIKYNELSYFFIQAGPRFSFLINQTVKNPSRGRPYGKDQDGKANNFDLSLSLAGGVSFGGRNNELIFRYDYSFTDAYPYLNEFETTGDPNAKLRKVQHIVSVSYSRVIF